MVPAGFVVRIIAQGPDPGGEGEISQSPRSLKEGEIGEWILLDAVSSVGYKYLGTGLTLDSISLDACLVCQHRIA